MYFTVVFLCCSGCRLSACRAGFPLPIWIYGHLLVLGRPHQPSPAAFLSRTRLLFVCKGSCSSRCLLFQRQLGAHSTTDTHRNNAVTFALPFHFMKSVAVSFEPVHPRGCPRAIAPPLTLTLSESIPSPNTVDCLADKASLISKDRHQRHQCLLFKLQEWLWQVRCP